MYIHSCFYAAMTYTGLSLRRHVQCLPWRPSCRWSVASRRSGIDNLLSGRSGRSTWLTPRTTQTSRPGTGCMSTCGRSPRTGLCAPHNWPVTFLCHTCLVRLHVRAQSHMSTIARTKVTDDLDVVNMVPFILCFQPKSNQSGDQRITIKTTKTLLSLQKTIRISSPKLIWAIIVSNFS